MKSFTFKLCSILTCAAIATPLIAWTSPSPVQAQEKENEVRRTGVITSWFLAADGTITFRLEGREEPGPVTGKPGAAGAQPKEATQPKEKEKEKDGGPPRFATWFTTAPDKSAVVHLDELVLQVVLQASTGSAPLTVTAKREPEKGDTMAKPLPLRTIGRY